MTYGPRRRWLTNPPSSSDVVETPLEEATAGAAVDVVVRICGSSRPGHLL